MVRKMGLAVLLAGLAGVSARAQVRTTVPLTGTAQNAAAAGRRRMVPPPPNKLKFGPPQIGPKVTNPVAAQKAAAMNGLLMSQRQAANTEAMKLRASNPGTNRMLNPQPLPPRNMPQVSGKQTGSLGPSHTMGASTTASHIGDQPLTNTTVVTCSHEPGMRILNVSGSSFPATFTPIQQYNFYTISGCSFGNVGPSAKVYIYKGATFHEEFQIQEWHDNWINVSLNSNLTGLLDQDNLTLVVQRADGQQASKGGYKFYAVRVRERLATMPQRFFGLYMIDPKVNKTGWRYTYHSPGTTNDGYGFGGMMAEVQWLDLNMGFMSGPSDTANAPHSGTDIYDFNKLEPGFVPTDADVQSQNVDCSVSSGTMVTAGQYRLEWEYGNQLWVTWQGQNCRNMSCGGAFQSDCFGQPLANYGLNVWVEGPKGIDPWTGRPTGN